MRKYLLFITVILFARLYSFGQCGGPTLTVNNPSFEGSPAPHVTPPQWDICQPGVTPDTQPGSWGISLPPYDGSSYIGLVWGGSSWVEGASQTLSSPMIAGTTYNFTLALASTSSTGGGILPGCVELQIWGNSGGNSGCDMSELLWASGDVYDAAHIDQWVLHTVTFTPSQNWGHMLFSVHTLGCSAQPYLMLDNLSPIIPQSDVAAFNAPGVCVNSPMPFTDASVSTSGTITNWNWNFGDGSPGSTTQNPAHTYTTPGTYDVTLTIYSNVPCTTQVVQQVIVHDYPTVAATADPAAICQGMSTTLTASGANSYSWSNGLGNAAQVTATPSASTTYTVTGTSNGCASTASVSVYVGQLQLNTIVNNHVSCFGGSDGSATVVPAGTPQYIYFWSPSGGNGPTASGLTAGTYTVSVSDSVNCQSSTSITVTEPPLLIVNISDSTNINCFGASTGTATVTASGGTLSYSYQWTPSGDTASTATGLPAGTYQVVVTDHNGCSDSDQITLTQQPQLHITLAPDDEDCPTYCDGFIESSVTGGFGSYDYSWSTIPVQHTSTANGLCPGNYTLTITDDYSCTSTQSANISTSAWVSADFTATPTSGYVPLSVEFIYTGNYGMNFYWDFGDGGTGTGSNITHIYDIVDLYEVTLYVNSGPPEYCPDTMTIYIDAMRPSWITVPNIFTPNGDGVNDVFQIESQAIEIMEIEIFNRWGKEMFSTNISGFTVEKEKKDVWDGTSKSGERCSDGVYYYIIYAKGYDDIEYKKNGTITLLR